MFYDQILARLGLTQLQTETLVSVAIVMIAVGFILVLFWKYVVAGAIVLSVLTVFTHSVTASNETEPVAKVAIQKSVEPVKGADLDDCMALTGKSDICEELADNGHVIKAASVALLDVDNEEYKSRRAEALKKPGAVVIKATYSDHDR
jgi:hypothetical protein